MPLELKRNVVEDTRITLRLAEAEDAGLILEFIKGLAECEKLADEVVADEDSIRRSLFGDRPAAEVMIAEYEGEPAGFALFFQNYSTFLGRPGIYLEDLFVKPEIRGHGIGRRLLSKLAQIAVERSCGRFEWSVLDWNKPAIDFYKKLGAHPMNGWTIFRLTGGALTELAKGN